MDTTDGRESLSLLESAVAGVLRRMREGEQATVGAIAAGCAKRPGAVRRVLAAWGRAGFVAVEEVQDRIDHPTVRHYRVSGPGREWLRSLDAQRPAAAA